MTRTSIFVCRDARGVQWQLGPLAPPTGRFTLIGWQQSTEQVDAGVPEEVARLLANALTAVARVTFLSSSVSPAAASAWSARDGFAVRALTGSSVGERITAKLRGIPSNITLLSTDRPGIALGLFDDGGFPWWQQGQIVLLSAREAAPPGIDADTLLALFEDDWTERAASLAGMGVEGVLRPGVDGDVAGLLSSTAAFEEKVVGVLEEESRRSGFEWSIVSETALQA